MEVWADLAAFWCGYYSLVTTPRRSRRVNRMASEATAPKLTIGRARTVRTTRNAVATRARNSSTGNGLQLMRSRSS